MPKSRAQVKREERRLVRKVIRKMRRDEQHADASFDVATADGRRFKFRDGKVYVNGVEIGTAEISGIWKQR